MSHICDQIMTSKNIYSNKFHSLASLSFSISFMYISKKNEKKKNRNLSEEKQENHLRWTLRVKYKQQDLKTLMLHSEKRKKSENFCILIKRLNSKMRTEPEEVTEEKVFKIIKMKEKFFLYEIKTRQKIIKEKNNKKATQQQKIRN